MAKRTPAVIGTLVVLGVALWGGRKILFAQHHVVTENAQIDSRLVPVSARLQAYVDRVLVDDNVEVKPGDTLVVLDTRDLDARIAKAQADLDAALAMAGTRRGSGQLAAQLEAARATAASAAAAVEGAQANAKKAAADLERIRGLAARQIVPAQQFDAAQAAATAAAATLEAAKRQQVAAEAHATAAAAAIGGADAQVAAARAALEMARLQRGYAVITAPMPATVSKRAVSPGALIQPGQTLMTLAPIDDLWITANIKETRMGHVAVGDSVSFTVDSYGGHEFFGTVESISPATGARFALLPPDNASGNFTKVVQNIPVRIAIHRPFDPKYPLRSGMSVEVTITTR